MFALCVAMHMAWNAPLDPPFHAKYLLLGFVAWVALLSFIQDGLKQVRLEQAVQTTVRVQEAQPAIPA